MGAAIFLLAAGWPLALVMRTRPEDYGLQPDGGPAAAVRPQSVTAKNSGDRDFTAREALRTSSFWMLSIAHSLSILALTAATVHQIPYMVSGLGMSAQAASFIVALFAGIQFAGQIGGGFIGDRVNKRYAIGLLTLGQAAALLTLGAVQNLAGPLIFAVVLGLCWGARMPLLLAIRGDYFGRKAYATIAGWLNTTLAAGSVIGPILAGFLADRIGNYGPVFVVLSALPALGAGLFLLARPPTHARGRGGPAPAT